MALGDDDAADRVYCQKNGIHYCEEGDPWAPGKTRRAYHPRASEITGSQRDGWPSGDSVHSRCPVCGCEWEHELPQ